MINPSTDIVLLESERMTDAADGGGRMTSTVIADGVAGNIFPKVSRLDTVYGRDNLRQIFGAVRPNNADTFAGAHAAILTPPANSRIGVLLFSTGSHSATRDQLRNLEDARAKLVELIRRALYVPPPRRPTRPSRAAKARRMDEKRVVGERKRERTSRKDYSD